VTLFQYYFLYFLYFKFLPKISSCVILNFRSFFHCIVDLSDKNSGGRTTFDMLLGDNQEINDMQCRARFFGSLHLPRVASNVDYLKYPVQSDEKIYIVFLRTRSILLVVAALLVNSHLPSNTQPPGRVWEDNNSSTTNASNSITPHTAGTSIMDEYLFFILAA
jgi:hypothetical protein